MTINPKLLEPTLLWENSSPTSNFDSQYITLNQSRDNFKYLIFEYYDKININLSTRFFKIRINSGVATTLLYFGQHYRDVNYGYTDKTKVFFGNADVTASNNDWLVPVRIYGTNIL